MKTDELSAWLIHQRPAKDNTTQAFFLTRERGLVRAFCAGGRGAKKRAVLQPFTPLWLTLNERHYGIYVKSVEISGAPQTLLGECLLAGLYLNELLYHALKPEAFDIALLDAYEAALKALAKAEGARMPLEIALRRFERALIETSGYQVSYQYDARTDAPICEVETYAFVPGEGFIADENGFLGAHLLAIGANNWDNPAILKPAKLIMRRAIDHLLDGAEIKTRALYQA